MKFTSTNKIYLLLAFVFVLSILGLGSWGLTESSEARYAEIGREMIVDNDFIHPRLLEIQHYHKPPLTYYVTALGYKIFGINEFGARFFLQLALLIQLFLTFKIGQILFKNSQIALSASIIYFTFPIVLISTNNLTTDAYLTTFIISSIYFWLQNKINHKIVGLYLSALSLGLGFITKGPVIFLPFLVFIFTYNYFFNNRTKITLHHFVSVLLFFAISIPWFILIIREIPELWNYFFETHTIERALNAEDFNRDKPFWYFLVYAPLVGIPWFVFLIILMFKNKTSLIKRDPVVKLLLSNIALTLLAFSLFSSKLILYVLPIYLFVALCCAYLIYNTKPKIINYFINSYKFLFLLVTLGILGSIFFGKLRLNDQSLYVLISLLVISSIFIYYKIFPSKDKRLFSISLIFAATILLTFRIVANQNPFLINSTKSLAEKIENIQNKIKKEKVVVFDSRLSALPFYLDQTTINIHRSKFETKREVLFEKDSEFRKYYWNINHENDFQNLLTFLNDKRGVFVTKKSKKFRDSIQVYLNELHSEEVDKWVIYY